MTTSRSDRRAARGPLALFGLGAALALSACVAPIRLQSEPAGAHLSWTDPGTGVLRRAVTPLDLVVDLRRPFPVAVTLDGYTPLTIDLRRTEGRPLRFVEGAVWTPARREVTVLLRPALPEPPTPPSP